MSITVRVSSKWVKPFITTARKDGFVVYAGWLTIDWWPGDENPVGCL